MLRQDLCRSLQGRMSAKEGMRSPGRCSSALGRQLTVEVIAAFSTWQPAMLGRTAGFGQKRTYPNVEGMRVPVKKFALGTLILLSMSISSSVSASRIPTCDRTSSQPNFGACSYEDLVAAENEMETVYRSIVAKYASNSLFLERLARAQKSWLTFREDDWKAQFACPEYNTQLC